MKLVPVYFVALVGLLLGGGLLTSDGLTSGTVLMLPLVALSLTLCRHIDDREVGLGQIFLLSVTLRWAVSALVHEVVYARQPGLFAPDEYFYDYAGRYYAEFLAGHVPDPSPGTFTGGIIWWTAISQYLTGSTMGPALFNGLMGAWTAVLTSLIALAIFSPAVARRAGLIAAFAPSLVLWSSLNIKDTSTLLGAQMVIFGAIELRRSFRAVLVLVLVSGLLLTASNRPYEVLFITGGVLVGLGAGEPGNRLRNLAVAAGMVVMLVVMLNSASITGMLASGDESAIDRISSLRDGYGLGANSVINVGFVDTRTAGGLAVWAPIGVLYFFLAPIPFTGGSTIAIATTPEMLVWYFLLPSVIRGLLLAVRHRAREVAPVLAYLLISSLGWAIVISNVGTLYRYRAQVLFLPIIFIAADQVRRKYASPAAAARPAFPTASPPRLVSVPLPAATAGAQPGRLPLGAPASTGR